MLIQITKQLLSIDLADPDRYGKRKPSGPFMQMLQRN